MPFNEIEVSKLKINPFVMLNEDWGLLSAGKVDKYNTMTIAWGSLGIMWAKPVFTVVVRPQRYTKDFIDNHDLFTVSFFPDGYRKALNILGTKSGKDCDKVAESGLTPMFTDDTVTFIEANMVFFCRKLHDGQQLDPEAFINTGIDSTIYPKKDYHYYYTGEIVKVLQK